MRGNVVDMAVGVIIGGAFGKIISSLVDDIIMPVVGLATGGMDFKDLKLTLKDPVRDAAGAVTQEECGRFSHRCFLHLYGHKGYAAIPQEGGREACGA